jgi:hypothetical protein
VAANAPTIARITWSGRHGESRVAEAEVLALAEALAENMQVQQVEIRYSPEAVTKRSVGAMLKALGKSQTLVSVDLGVESVGPQAVCHCGL